MKCTLTLSNDRSESKRIEKAWVGTAMFVAVLAATLVSVSLVPTPAHAEPNSEIDAADDGRITQAIKDKKRDGTYQTFRVNERRNIARKKWHKTTTIPSHLSGAAGDTREQKIKDLIRQAKEGWQGGPDFVRTELVYGDNYSMLRIDRFYLTEDNTEEVMYQYIDLDYHSLQTVRDRMRENPLLHIWEDWNAGSGGLQAGFDAMGDGIAQDLEGDRRASRPTPEEEWEQVKKERGEISAMKKKVRTAINDCKLNVDGDPVSNLIAKLEVYKNDPEWQDDSGFDTREIGDLERAFHQQVIEPHSRYQAAVQDLQTIIPKLQADCDFDPARKHLRAVRQAMLGVRAECRVPDYNWSLSDMSDRIDIMESDKDGGYIRPLIRAEEVVSNFETDLSTSANLQETQRCKNIESTIGMLGDFSVGPVDYAASGIAKNACNEPQWAVERRAKVEAHAQSLLAKAKASLADDQGAPELLREAAAAIAESQCNAPVADKLLSRFEQLTGICDATLVSRGKELRSDTQNLMKDLKTGIDGYANAVSLAHTAAKDAYDHCKLKPFDPPEPGEGCYFTALSETDKQKLREIGDWSEKNNDDRDRVEALEYAENNVPTLASLCKLKGARTQSKFWRAQDHADKLRNSPRACLKKHKALTDYDSSRRNLERASQELDDQRQVLADRLLDARGKKSSVANWSYPLHPDSARELQEMLDVANQHVKEIKRVIRTDEDCWIKEREALARVEAIQIPDRIFDEMAAMQDPEALRRIAAKTARASLAPGGKSEAETSKGKLSAEAAKSQVGETSEDETPPKEDAQIALAVRAMNECRFSDADLEISKVKSSGGQAGLMAELARLRAREKDISRTIDEAVALQMQENYGAALSKLRSLRSQCHTTQGEIDNRIAMVTLAQTQAQESRFAAAGAALDDCDYARFESHYAQLPDGERKGELGARKAAALSRDAAVNELFQRGTGLAAKGAFRDAVASLEKASGMARCATDRTRVAAALARANQGAAQVAALQCGPNASKHFNAGSGLPECVCNAGYTPTVKGNGCSDPFTELKARFEEEDRQQRELEQVRLEEERYQRDQEQRRWEEDERYTRAQEQRRWEEEEQYRRAEEERRWEEEDRRWEEEERRWEEEDRYLAEQQRKMDQLYDEENRRQQAERERGWERDRQSVREIEGGGKPDYAGWCAANPDKCDIGGEYDLCEDGSVPLLGGCY